jgi:four helix bundle protein
MKQSPKSEIRNPKEGRRPKSEGGREMPAESDSALWSWGDRTDPKFMVLRENGTYGKEPRQDLAERTAKFGEAVIKFAKRIPQGPINNRLIAQLVGAATSIGANYCEADDSVSGKEFKQKIGFARKESKETMHFLRMVAASEEALATEARALWREAKELNLIFGAIWRK